MNSPFLSACVGQKTPCTPIWLMRQIGRYQKEYQQIRKKVGFLELCKRPDLVSELTTKTVEQLGVDAAIIFADILLITEPMGFSLHFDEGKGPQIENPFRNENDLTRTKVAEASSLSFVAEAIRQSCKALPKEIPLIGFAGAPFTVAAYIIEGRSSKHFEHTKVLMRADPRTWNQLLDRISQGTISYLQSQLDAGAQALQLFDSWIGALRADEYRTYVLPHVQKIFRSIPSSIPTIHFGTGTAHLLEVMKEAGGTVMGVDFHLRLEAAWKRLGPMALQGNLDPTVLLASGDVIDREARDILEQSKGKSGHIFNLGHGILPSTPVDHVRRLVDTVHNVSAKSADR